MPNPRSQAPSVRRGHLRRTFDGRVRQEWRRYAGEAHRVLRRQLRERFLERNLRGGGPVLLELGPGPGRFTPTLLRGRRRVVAIDLSRVGLRSAQRRSRRLTPRARVDYVQGAGEHLPLAARSIDVAVVLGNIVCFAGRDSGPLLNELARVVRPGGRLLVDFASPGSSIQDFLYTAGQRGLLPRILRDPRRYFLDRVLETGWQPYAPDRMAQWEFRFYTADEATAALRGAGFRAVDVMSIAPLAAFQAQVAAVARRERRTWETLLRTEERLGRRPGLFESGHGFAVLALRRGPGRGPTPRPGKGRSRPRGRAGHSGVAGRRPLGT